MTNCELCGEPMPEGEEMFKFHGYSGNCPKPSLPKGYAPSPADLVGVDTSLLFEEVIRRLNYDGPDTDSLTVGEIRRALP